MVGGKGGERVTYFAPHLQLASFPDSTPQLFIHSAIKSWGVESRNEANLQPNV